VIARIVARQITIKREEPHRRAFRRDAGGYGFVKVPTGTEHSPTVSTMPAARRIHRWTTQVGDRRRSCAGTAGCMLPDVPHFVRNCSRPLGNAGGTSARTPSTVLPQRTTSTDGAIVDTERAVDRGLQLCSGNRAPGAGKSDGPIGPERHLRKRLRYTMFGLNRGHAWGFVPTA
jgi:hypothetical protein